ncbi:tetratricopeptide repeat-containing protein [Catellatospora paridis]|uniref:tetratricopeptide repeat-containing protein n=1 Tax=Catellatospora paridis TaxID=1617086 RepID=UPI0012D3FB3D|nr:tetratricopeptide repeat-containing protein [Catellatospora paridis]
MSVTQVVTVENGFGYGLIGADLHVFQDRGPVYVLTSHRPAPPPDPAGLSEQPSRLLNARHRVVPFSGRDDELARLRRWRDGRGMSAMWLHGPGGAGKTRLAAEFADMSAAAGWKVVDARHGPGAVIPPPGSQDLTLDNAAGLLMVVDYADRWPLTHLAWLMSNAILHRGVPTRLLLLARSAYTWQAVRSLVEELDGDVHDLPLGPLPTDRERMFRAARDAFAGRYGVAPETIAVPARLNDPEFGLTLTVHMAALVAVDEKLRGSAKDVAAGDPAALSVYLLDREFRHWSRLHESRVDGAEFGTAPSEMTRLVFTAALTGATPYDSAVRILRPLELPGHPDRLLADHARCYPPAEPATVLEPLYPDRLAEDFLALTLPGHPAHGHQSRPWAPSTVATLVHNGATTYAGRALTFLAAAAAPGRWPHVAGHLATLLRGAPELALAGGSATLTALADIEDLDPAVLAALDPLLPERAQADLDLGLAAIARRRTDQAIASGMTGEPLAALFVTLARRYVNAGLFEPALDAALRVAELVDEHSAMAAAGAYEQSRALSGLGRRVEAAAVVARAVDVYRDLVEGDGHVHLPRLADALHLHARESTRPDPTRMAQALAQTEEAVAIYRGLTETDQHRYLPDLAGALNSLTIRLLEIGRPAEGLAAALEAVTMRRDLAERDPDTFLPDLATSLNNLGNAHASTGSHYDALTVSRDAVAIRRRLVETNPYAYEQALALALNNLAMRLTALGHADEAIPVFREAEARLRELMEANPAANRQFLGLVLINLAGALPPTQPEQVLTLASEAVEVFRWLAADRPDTYLAGLSRALNNHSAALSAVGQNRKALTVIEEAVALRRQLAETDPSWLPDLAASVENLATTLQNLGRGRQATAPQREAASIRAALAAEEDPTAKARATVAVLRQGGNPADLAAALANLGSIQARSAPADAEEPLDEASGIYRSLADTEPDLYQPRLAVVLHNETVNYLGLAQAATAAYVAEELVAVLRRLTDRAPDFYRPALARALGLQATAQGQSGDLAAGEQTAQEAVAQYKQLVQQAPYVFKTELKAARSLEDQLHLAPLVQAKLRRRLGRYGLRPSIMDRLGLTSGPVTFIVMILVGFLAIVGVGVVFVVTLPWTVVSLIRRRIRGRTTG